jgi:hypothetical protein
MKFSPVLLEFSILFTAFLYGGEISRQLKAITGYAGYGSWQSAKSQGFKLFSCLCGGAWPHEQLLWQPARCGLAGVSGGQAPIIATIV